MTIKNATLPELLSAILEHPELPAPIYNAIADGLTDIKNEVQPDEQTPEYIEVENV